jgi:predicted GNAT family N-acyltransferase
MNEVFIREQSVPVELEFENEGSSEHYLLWVDGRPVGCGRYRRTTDGFKLERIAVLRSDRGKGHGKAIVEGLVEAVRTKGVSTIYLNSQTSAKGFYERSGFRPVGDEFLEAGIWHIRMVLDKGGNEV